MVRNFWTNEADKRALVSTVDAGGEVDEAFGTFDTGKAADFVQHLVQFLGRVGRDKQDEVEATRACVHAFDLRNGRKT